MNRQTPFGMAGQQSFSQMPQGLPQGDPLQQFQNSFGQPQVDPYQGLQQQFSNMNQFNSQAQNYNQNVLMGQDAQLQSLMKDYENLRGDVNQLSTNPYQRQGRPQSRELDLMNLLLIGSMDQGQKSGLEGLGGLIGQQNPSLNNSHLNMNMPPNQQMMNPMQMPIAPQTAPNMYQGYEQPLPQFAAPQYQQPQQYPQEFPQHQYPQIPPYSSNNSRHQQSKSGQIMVNNQMGINVDKQQNIPEGVGQQPGNDRIHQHIERQNQILEQLTKNLMQQRQEKQTTDKKKLMSRIQDLEQLNSQDGAFDFYDKDFEVPQYKRPNQRPMMYRPPPMQYLPQSYGQPPYQQQAYGQPYGFQNNFNQYPAQQSKQDKLEKLQMMALMKKLKDELAREKQKKKGKKGKKKRGSTYEQEFINESISDEDLEDEDASVWDSEESIEKVQKPRVMKPKPIPQPPVYDPSVDEKKMIELKRLRGNRNITTAIKAIKLMMLYKNEWVSQCQGKREQTNNDFPGWVAGFAKSTQEWILRINQKNLEEFFKTPKLTLHVTQIGKKPLKKKEFDQNSEKLKYFVKRIIDSIVDNSEEDNISEEIIYFLGMNAYFTKFELNRLNFNYRGTLKDMNQQKAYMMLCTNIWIRVIIQMTLPKASQQFPSVQVTDQTKINIKTICSVLYELVMQFLRGTAAVQMNNQKHIPVEYQVKEKKEIYYKIDSLEPTQDDILQANQKQKSGEDEPLLIPLYSLRDMGDFFDNERGWTNTMIALIEGWCEKLWGIVDNYYKEMKQEELDVKKEEKQKIIKQYQSKKDSINQLVSKRKQEYMSVGKDIEELKEKIIRETELDARRQEEYQRLIIEREKKYGKQ